MGTLSLVLALCIVFVALTLAKRALVIVPSEHVFVVERLGKFKQLCFPGLHVLIPFVDHIAREFSSESHELYVPEHRCVSANGSMVAISGKLFYTVTDAYKACYAVSDVSFAMLQVIQRILQESVEGLLVERLCERPAMLEEAVRSAVSSIGLDWGVVIDRVAFDVRPCSGRVA